MTTTNKKPGRGRPGLAVKTHGVIAVPVTRQELAAIRRDAAEAGMTPPHLARRVLGLPHIAATPATA